MLNLPLSVVPPQRPPLARREEHGHRESDQAEDDDAAPHLRYREGPLEHHDREAETGRRSEHLRDDHQDQADRQALANACRDLRARTRKHHASQPRDAGEAVGACGVLEHGVDGAYPFDRVQQDRPDRTRDDHQDLHLVVDADDQHQHRYEDRRRDRSEELQQRFGQLPYPPHRTDQEPEGDAEDDRGRGADQEARETGQHIRTETLPRPGVDAGGPQFSGLGNVEARGVERRHPPDADQDGRQRDRVHRSYEDPHAGTSSRTETCHDNTVRSTARATRLMSTPISPTCRISAYIWVTAPPDFASAICSPSPPPPMTSSPVIARINATAAPSRTPVMTYGSALGHTRWRSRARRPSP